MTASERLFRRFVPRNDTGEDKELEEVSKVMRLYKILTATETKSKILLDFP
jgi:hypothetical protein